jgi:hypothetical protein
MNRQKEQKPGYGKILDAWIPPDNAGDPIGCVATSFTFSPVLFEEECLGRFLQLETNATEDGPAYLVEREEKLSQVQCAALVDQHYACGVRSLRWDLLPARLPRGVLHAKVSLLLWSRYTRLIVASANLTEDGYRRNHEVFGVLDYFAGSKTPLAPLDEIVVFLVDAVSYADPAARSGGAAIRRWNDFLTHVSKVTRGWGTAKSPPTIAKPRSFAVITGPGRASAFDTLRKQWPDNSPPSEAFVVSPFFDPPDVPNAPARTLWALLKQRGEATVEFDVTAEDVPGEKAILIHAPESLMDARPTNRSQTETLVKRVKLTEGRPLHAKSLWLQNDRVILLMIGSSNFTTAGLGIGVTQNLEVNLTYVVSQHTKKVAKAFFDAWLPVEDVPDGVELRWQPRLDDGDDSATLGLVLLPLFFGQATFGCDKQQRGFVEFTFNGTPPTSWALFVEDDREPFLNGASWQRQGDPTLLRLSWDRNRPPSGFRVSWRGSSRYRSRHHHPNL